MIVPALVLLLGLTMTLAVGTSLVIVSINSAAGFLAHAGESRLDLAVTVEHPRHGHRGAAGRAI